MKSNGETPARLPRILQELVQRAIVMIIEAWLQASVGVILDGPKVNYTVVKVLYEKSPGGPCSCSELISERNFKGAEATHLAIHAPSMGLLFEYLTAGPTFRPILIRHVDTPTAS
jgi:hypothetical protein